MANQSLLRSYNFLRSTGSWAVGLLGVKIYDAGKTEFDSVENKECQILEVTAELAYFRKGNVNRVHFEGDIELEIPLTLLNLKHDRLIENFTGKICDYSKSRS